MITNLKKSNFLVKIARKIATAMNIYIKGPLHPRPSILRMKELGNKDLKVIEIGTFKGNNARAILKNLDVKEIYLIDPYTSYEEYTNFLLSEKVVVSGLDKAEKIAKERLKKFKAKKIWIKKFSEKAINDVPEVDFIYIDGNHSYKYVKRDIELYFQKLRKGGIMAGHDIEWKSVFKAVSDFAVKNNLNCYMTYPDWIIET